MTEAQRDATSTDYERRLDATFEGCSLATDGRVRLRSADRRRSLGLPDSMVDVQVTYGNGNSFPLSNVTVDGVGRFRIPKHVRDAYGLSGGHGATVDVTVVGVIQNV